MIRENQQLFNRLNMLSDGLITALSMLIAYWLRYIVFHGDKTVKLGSYVWLAVISALVSFFIYAIMGLYESHRIKRFEHESQKIFLGAVLDTIVLIAALFVLRKTDFSRWLLVTSCLLETALLLLKRFIVRKLLRTYRAKGYNQKHVIVLGAGDNARRYAEILRDDPALGFVIDGYVANREELEGVKWLGEYNKLETILSGRNFDEVILAIPPEEHTLVGGCIQICEKTGTKLSLIPHYAEYMPSNPQIDNVDGLQLINLRRIPLDNMMNAFIKRSIDIVGSLVLIILTSPLMLISVIGVKLSSPGPILFKQERVGLNKRKFKMLKFRSMRVNNESSTAWSTNKDPRKTRFGSFIRKCSIDELPQFFNVLRGDMSLVGPRPEIPHYVEKFREEIPRYMVKHQVRPGITGWAQVNGYRGDTSIAKRIEYDIYYIENWNFFFDIKILLMTFTKSINSEKLS